jgi:hypothetical protein
MCTMSRRKSGRCEQKHGLWVFPPEAGTWSDDLLQGAQTIGKESLSGTPPIERSQDRESVSRADRDTLPNVVIN